MVSEYERMQRRAEREREQRRKAAEKAALEKHVASRLREVEEKNAALATIYAEIDDILAATLRVDDYVDLNDLQVKAQHPPFDPGALGIPTPGPEVVPYPPRPVYEEPAPPGFLASLFGAKKKHPKLVEQARAQHQNAMDTWTVNCQACDAQRSTNKRLHEEAEAKRLEQLEAARARYDDECRNREAVAQAENEKLTKLANDLAFDVPQAIEDYIGIVLFRSVYPESFPVTFEHSFDLSTRELHLALKVPGPKVLPSVKEYRYVKSKDEITESLLSTKAQKDRYAEAVWQVAVRSLHEVFEADRLGKIHSVALQVATDVISEATGRPERVPLVVVAAERETFISFDIANVVPRATLEHLGAALSKSPFDLMPADTGRTIGVRGR